MDLRIRLISLGLHAGRVLDIDSIKVNGPTKRQKKMEDIKESKAKNGN
jgi:hypothetical protein